MKLESHTINITLSFSDSVGAHEISVSLHCSEPSEQYPTFSSEFSSLPESTFSREFLTAYNSAMRELSGHYPTFTFLTI
jgi:hypothetical protein